MARGLVGACGRACRRGRLYVAIGILGATVMPHNLYLHSALVQTRRIGGDAREQGDGVPLLPARLGDCAQRGVLRQRGDPGPERGGVSPPRDGGRQHRGGVQAAARRSWERPRRSCSAIALLCAGQSSTLTGTLAGQIVMEGYLHLRMAPWLRRLITRLIALVPAVVVISLAGEQSTQRLLILSQVILSLQLSFAVIPLIHFTSNRRNMGDFATPWWGQSWRGATAAVIVALERQAGPGPGRRMGGLVGRVWRSRVGPIPLSWLVAGGLYGVTGGAACLLCLGDDQAVRASHRPRGCPKPSVKLDWVEALRPRPLATIGVALEHNQADAEILNRALGLAQTQNEPSELVLLHVVDTPMTRVLGPETADRESGADERYLADLVAALARSRLQVAVGLAARPRPGRRARRLPPARPGRPAGRRLARPRHGPRPAPGSDRRPGPAQPGRAHAHRPARPRGGR